MLIKKYFPVIICLGLIAGCQSEPKKEQSQAAKSQGTTTKKENLNVSILLDLSDRIDTDKNANPSMEFYKRDLGYIESISKGFEKYLRSKTSRLMNDQIQVYFEPEPMNPEINELAKKMKFSFTKDNAKTQEILKISKLYSASSEAIYKLALKDKQYSGSDIWGFFKNKVNDYCIKSDHRNILFILTDGYMFHKDSKFMEGNRSSYLLPEMIRSLKLNTSAYQKLIEEKNYGFIPANNDLSNLEVFVLGINPNKGNPFEGDVIMAYWNKWLKEMNTKKYELKRSDLPTNLDLVIQKYINP